MIQQANTYHLNVQECEKSNVLICGLTGSGKTRLVWARAQNIADYIKDILFELNEMNIIRLLIMAPNED